VPNLGRLTVLFWHYDHYGTVHMKCARLPHHELPLKYNWLLNWYLIFFKSAADLAATSVSPASAEAGSSEVGVDEEVEPRLGLSSTRSCWLLVFQEKGAECSSLYLIWKRVSDMLPELLAVFRNIFFLNRHNFFKTAEADRGFTSDQIPRFNNTDKNGKDYKMRCRTTHTIDTHCDIYCFL
jgi:hypothetical protein